MEIWHLDLHLDRAAYHRACALLDAQERASCARLRGAQLRHRYAAAHAGLRRLLARRLRCPPAQVLLAREPGGKLRLRPGPGRPLHFSLAHAGDHALVAMSAEHPVGVDLELLPPPCQAALDLDAHLSAAERQALASLPPGDQDHAALRCWVRKEALLKASGHGLALPPSAFTVSFEGEPRLLTSDLPQYLASQWALAAHESAEWTAAVAWPVGVVAATPGAPGVPAASDLPAPVPPGPARPAAAEEVLWLHWPEDAALLDAEPDR